MSYKIIPTEHFKQQVRILQKDYPNIRRDLKELLRSDVMGITLNQQTGDYQLDHIQNAF